MLTDEKAEAKCANRALGPHSITSHFTLFAMFRFSGLFLLVLCGIGALAECRQVGEQSIYLLPNHFVGNVLVAFDQHDGAPIEYRHGARLYRIPLSGILRTQFKPNYGLHQPDQYYYVDAQGKELWKLVYTDDFKKISSNQFSSDTICFYNAPATDSNDPKTHYTAFAVSRIEKLDSIRQLQDAAIFKLAAAK